MLALLAHGVATYRDCPDEAESLQQVCLEHLAVFRDILRLLTRHCCGLNSASALDANFYGLCRPF